MYNEDVSPYFGIGVLDWLQTQNMFTKTALLMSVVGTGMIEIFFNIS